MTYNGGLADGCKHDCHLLTGMGATACGADGAGAVGYAIGSTVTDGAGGAVSLGTTMLTGAYSGTGTTPWHTRKQCQHMQMHTAERTGSNVICLSTGTDVELAAGLPAVARGPAHMHHCWPLERCTYATSFLTLSEPRRGCTQSAIHLVGGDGGGGVVGRRVCRQRQHRLGRRVVVGRLGVGRGERDTSVGRRGARGGVGHRHVDWRLQRPFDRDR